MTNQDNTEQVWFYNLHGERRGPVAPDGLRRLLDDRLIGPDTPVWRKGMTDWQTLRGTELGAGLVDEPPIVTEQPPPVKGPYRAPVREPAATGDEWFYTWRGDRKGPVSAQEVKSLLADRTIDVETQVWRKGMAEWQPLRQTDLAAASADEPPPVITGEIDNSWVWILALAPLAYLFADVLFAGYAYDNPGLPPIWSKLVTLYIPWGINIVLSLIDEGQLKRAGYSTKNMTIFAIVLVPAYLFVRAKRLRQSPVYGLVWVASFAVSMIVNLAMD